MSTIAPSPPLSGSRLAVAGGLVGLFAMLVLMAGAGVYWADGKKDADGYFTTKTERFVTTSYAIASDDLDVSGVPLASDRFGKVRLQVRERNGKPVFAGIARTRDVDAYLAGTAHDTLTDRLLPFAPEYRTADGERRPQAPAAQGFWVASATGSGTQTLDWKARDGSWSVVLMNADGSPAVDAAVSAGVSLPFLDDLGLWLWIAAAALLALAGALIAGGLRRGRLARLERPSIDNSERRSPGDDHHRRADRGSRDRARSPSPRSCTGSTASATVTASSPPAPCT